MKKGLFTILMGALALGTFAQQTIPASKPIDAQKINAGYTKRIVPILPASAGGQMSQWFSYAELQVSLNNFTENAPFLFPDSNVTVQYLNSGNPASYHNTWFASGQTFDPKDQEYSFFDPGNGQNLEPLSKFNSWSVDSISILYIYDRKLDASVVDTAIVKVYKTNGGLSYWQFSATNIFAVAEWDRTLRESKSVGGIEFRRPLTTLDSNGNSNVWGTLDFGLNNYNLAKGDEMAVTISFKPGFSYNNGDTMFATTDFPTQPVKKFNTFRVRTVDNNANVENLFYNNGLMVDKTQQYTNRLTGAGFENTAKFLPSNFYGVSQFTDIRYHVSSPNVGIKNINSNGYGMGDVYPNPASAKGSLVVPFAIGKAGEANMTITNIIGQNVITASNKFNAGENNFKVSMNSLKPGVYFCTVNSGNFTATKKITVTE